MDGCMKIGTGSPVHGGLSVTEDIDRVSFFCYGKRELKSVRDMLLYLHNMKLHHHSKCTPSNYSSLQHVENSCQQVMSFEVTVSNFLKGVKVFSLC